MKKERKKVSKILLAALGCSIALTACGSSYSAKDSAYPESPALMQWGESNESYYSGASTNGIYVSSDGAEPSESNPGSSQNNGAREGRKLIRTVSMSVETLEFDKLVSYVESETDANGGYIEDMYLYNGSGYEYYSYGSGFTTQRRASLTIRIPAEQLDGFLVLMSDRSNIIQKTESEQDVTLDYVDLDSHKQVLLTEQQRLLELLEQAETLEDILILEDRLSDIRYQIESMESRLRTYDNQIDYSTIYLEIQEVVELTPIAEEEPTFAERMKEGFMESVEDIGISCREAFITFVTLSPYLMILLAVTAVTLAIIFATLRLTKKKNGAGNVKAGGPAQSAAEKQEEDKRA